METNMATIASAETRLDRREMQFIYQDGDGYLFMDPDSCEQVILCRERVGELLYLKEGMRAHLVFRAGEAVGLEPPGSVELTVADTDPAGGPVSRPRKPAVLETGLKVLVPAFVEIGDTIVVDPHTSEYLGRARTRNPPSLLP